MGPLSELLSSEFSILSSGCRLFQQPVRALVYDRVASSSSHCAATKRAAMIDHAVNNHELLSLGQRLGALSVLCGLWPCAPALWIP
jgi:hypothetical protein